MTAGLTVAEPSLFFESSRMTEMLHEAKTHYEYIIFDTSPILTEPDALLLGQISEGLIFPSICMKTLIIIKHHKMMEQVYNLTQQIAAFRNTTRSLAVLVFVLLSGSVFAQTVSIQGVLRDPNGRSVDDGFYEVTFKIYDADTGGTALWTDTYASLETRHGVFQANLGENTSLDGLGFDPLSDLSR